MAFATKISFTFLCNFSSFQVAQKERHSMKKAQIGCKMRRHNEKDIKSDDTREPIDNKKKVEPGEKRQQNSAKRSFNDIVEFNNDFLKL